MELGLYTFGDIVADYATGIAVSPLERMDQMLAMARAADEGGLDVFGVGEHHPLRYVNSATATILAAMAAVTRRIRLTSGTTLIATADPVREFQAFATADLVSHGRVEMIVGRGAFTDVYDLFGFDLKDYDSLFMEKLGLLLALNSSERVTWQGRFRPPLHAAEIAPRPAQKLLPITIGAGRVESAARAGALGLPLAIPMLGGTIDGYAAVAESYRAAFRATANGPDKPSVSVFAHLAIGERPGFHEEFFPYYSAYLEPLFHGPMPASVFEQFRSPDGGLVSGTVQQVVDKLMTIRDRVGCDRFVGQIDIGGQPFADVMAAVGLFASDVAPAVRKATA